MTEREQISLSGCYCVFKGTINVAIKERERTRRGETKKGGRRLQRESERLIISAGIEGLEGVGKITA